MRGWASKTVTSKVPGGASWRSDLAAVSPAGPAPGFGMALSAVAQDGGPWLGHVQSLDRKGATHRQHTPSLAFCHQDEMSVWGGLMRPASEEGLERGTSGREGGPGGVERRGRGGGRTTREPEQGGLQKPGRGGACGCGTQSFDSRFEGLLPTPDPRRGPDSRVFLIVSHQIRWVY